MSLWNKTDTELSKPKFMHRGEIVGINITNPGSGYTAPTVAFSVEQDETGSGAAVTLVAAGGTITDVAITAGGTGYSNAPVATITDDTGEGATVELVVAEGVITDAVLTDPGSGYSIAPTITITDDTGADATAELTVTGGEIISAVITNPGGGYSIPPTVTITDDTGTDAELEVVIKHGEYNSANIVFADNTEASIAENKARGINSPGWWYHTTKETDGVTRHVSHQFVEVSAVQNGTTGDASDDSVLADS